MELDPPNKSLSGVEGSASTATTKTELPYNSLKSSNTPVSAKLQHGPHQTANKSNNTGLP